MTVDDAIELGLKTLAAARRQRLRGLRDSRIPR